MSHCCVGDLLVLNKHSSSTSSWLVFSPREGASTEREQKVKSGRRAGGKQKFMLSTPGEQHAPALGKNFTRHHFACSDRPFPPFPPRAF